MRISALLFLYLAACGGGPDDPAGDDADAPDARTGDPPACGALVATIRDFSQGHPDFEEPDGNSDTGVAGLVERSLGPDGTPVYAHPGPVEPHTAGPEWFAHWYHDVPEHNRALAYTIELVASGDVQTFDSDAFFPVDGQGFGDEGFGHNFHFTTEVHTSFVYAGGEIFRFEGDDDLWLFVNRQLALDLGGLHPPLAGVVDLDAQAADLGIAPGGTYAMDIFHAERHTSASNFHVETTIDCFIVP